MPKQYNANIDRQRRICRALIKWGIVVVLVLWMKYEILVGSSEYYYAKDEIVINSKTRGTVIKNVIVIVTQRKWVPI